MAHKSKFIRLLLRIVLGLILGLILLFTLIVLLIRMPCLQDRIVRETITYVQGKTSTVVELDRLFITFSGNVYLEGLYVEDLNGDTLIYIRQLETGVAYMPLFNKEIHITKIDWDGFRANVHRNSKDSLFNYEFILGAFVTKDSIKVPSPADTSATTQFKLTSVGLITLKDFQLKYRDDLEEQDAYVSFDRLHINNRTFDLEKLNFDIKKLELENSLIRFFSDKSLLGDTEKSESETTSSPKIKLDNLFFKNIDIDFASPKDSIATKANFGELILELDIFDLDKREIAIEEFTMKSSKIEAQLPLGTGDKSDLKVKKMPKEQVVIEFPEWNIQVKSMKWNDNHVEIHRGSAQPLKDQFDVNHIVFSDIDIEMRDFIMSPEILDVRLSKFDFIERSQWELKKMRFDLKANQTNFSLQKAFLETGHSKLNFDVEMTYTDLNNIALNPQSTIVDFNFKPSTISLEDAFYFAPELRKDTVLRPFKGKPFIVEGKLDGRIGDLNVNRLAIAWGSRTKLTASGKIRGLPNSDISFNLPTVEFRSEKTDYDVFLPHDSLKIHLPDKLILSTSLHGDLKKLYAKGQLIIPEGELKFDTQIRPEKPINIDADLALNQMDLGKLFNNDSLGKVSLTLTAKGVGTDLKTMNASVKGNLVSLFLGENEFKNIDFNGTLVKENLVFELISKDPQLLLDLNATADLNELHPEYNLVVNVKNVSPSDLQLTKAPMVVSGNLTANMKGPLDNFNAFIKIENGRAVKNGISYKLSKFDIKGTSSSNNSTLLIESDLLNGNATWNKSWDSLFVAIDRFTAPYFGREPVENMTISDLKLDGVFTFHESALLKEVLLPKLEKLEAGELVLSFNAAENLIDMNWKIEKLFYDQIRVYNADIDIETVEKSMNLVVAWDSIFHPNATIYRSKTTASYDGKKYRVTTDIANDTLAPLYHFDIEGLVEDEMIEVHFNSEKLLLNGESWSIIPTNKLVIYKEHIHAEDFVISRENQSLTLLNNPDLPNDNLGIVFNQFSLSTFTSLFQSEFEQIDGKIQGDLWVMNLRSASSFEADLQIVNLTARGELLGDLTLEGKSEGRNSYSANLKISGGAANLELDGTYTVIGENTNLNLNLDLKSLKLVVLEKYAQDVINNASGEISGKVKISGSPKKPIYDGSIRFKDASVIVAAVNERFLLADEQLDVRNQGIYFKEFQIRDSRGKISSIVGHIETETLTNPTLFFDVVAKDFSLLNSTAADNDLFFGTLLADLNISLRGTAITPVVSARARLNRGSNLTIVIPESRLAVVEREGIVLFVDMKQPLSSDSIRQDVYAKNYGNIELRAILEIDSSTILTIVIDEESGDNILVRGEANLSVDIESNGRINISGDYNIRGGHYEMSMYSIVRRRFQLYPGSKIQWSGDPLGAQLDLKAIYKTSTHTLDLMSAQLVDADQATRNRYRQELPFEVLLNIKGTLLKPAISFGLDMPELQRNALGGNVYGKIQQLNENESELNKQVFSLIVLNRFLPEDLSQTFNTGVGTESIARSSVSQLLSSQLNSLSGKYIKGIDLDFNLDNFTDYQTGTATNRTQLNLNLRKALLNDRLIVSVGSRFDIEGESPTEQNGVGDIIGDVSLDYLLVPDGRYRLRGFRRNEFEGLIDGQIIVTGISIAYTRDFDRFRELWKKPVTVKDSIPPVIKKVE
jgi:translocation and assembly module TamB